MTTQSQRGFAVGLILLVVILLAAIVAAVATSSREGGQNADGEEGIVLAGAIIEQAIDIENRIKRATTVNTNLNDFLNIYLDGTRRPPPRAFLPGTAASAQRWDLAIAEYTVGSPGVDISIAVRGLRPEVVRGIHHILRREGNFTVGGSVAFNFPATLGEGLTHLADAVQELLFPRPAYASMGYGEFCLNVQGYSGPYCISAIQGPGYGCNYLLLGNASYNPATQTPRSANSPMAVSCRIRTSATFGGVTPSAITGSTDFDRCGALNIPPDGGEIFFTCGVNINTVITIQDNHANYVNQERIGRMLIPYQSGGEGGPDGEGVFYVVLRR